MIRRVIFIATPHDGSPVATTLIGKFATRVVRRPSDTEQAIAQIDRDNPGAWRPFLLRRVPSSIDMLAADNPLLPAMRQLPFSPAVTLHTIAGHGIHSPDRARGDLVVPLSSPPRRSRQRALGSGGSHQHLLPAADDRRGSTHPRGACSVEGNRVVPRFVCRPELGWMKRSATHHLIHAMNQETHALNHEIHEKE